MAPQKRILVLNSLDGRYGSTYRIRALERLLSERGFEIDYIEKDWDPFSKLFCAVRSAATGQYDLLFTQKFNPITLAAMLIAKFRGKPVVVDWDDLDAGLQSNLIKKWLAAVCEAAGPRLATRITTHSESIRARAARFCPADLIPQGYDETVFRPGSRNGGPTRIIGHLCTFTHGGTIDLEVILKAWARIQDPAVTFMLVGGGPLESVIRREIDSLGLKDRVHLTGLLPQEKIPAVLDRWAAGVVFMSDTPANRARVSFKVIEYLAMNVPVVGQTVGETERLFGKWIRRADGSELPDALLRAIASPARPDTGEAVRDYAWSRSATKIVDSVSQAIDERGYAAHIAR